MLIKKYIKRNGVEFIRVQKDPNKLYCDICKYTNKGIRRCTSFHVKNNRTLYDACVNSFFLPYHKFNHGYIPLLKTIIC